MVSIPDFESGNPGSNPGETLYLYSSVEECLAHNQEDQGSKPCGDTIVRVAQLDSAPDF